MPDTRPDLDALRAIAEDWHASPEVARLTNALLDCLALMPPERVPLLRDSTRALFDDLVLASPATGDSRQQCPCRDFDGDGDECRRCGHAASSHVQTSDDGDQVCDGAPLVRPAPYCPCGGRCHHSASPCSFGCLAFGDSRQSAVDVR